MPDNFAEQERLHNIGVLMRYVTDYLTLRAAHLYRVRPDLRGQLDDLTHQIRGQIERCLRADRSFGAKRVHVANILIGDDPERRRAVLTPTDQNTLINDIIDKKDEGGKQTAGAVAVKDLRTLYGHFDPKLDHIVETLQSQLWLDFPDIIEFANAEISIAYLVEIMKKKAVPDNIKASVNRQLNRQVDRDLALEEALLLHYHRARRNLDSIKRRQSEEELYKQLIRRELTVEDSDSVNQLIMECARHIHTAGQLRNAGELNDQQRSAFAQAMGVAPEKVTAETALQHERRALVEARNQLAKELMKHSASGTPVNHKAHQLREMLAHLEKIAGALKQAGVDLEKGPPAANVEKEN